MQQCCIARLKSNKYKQCSKKTSNNSDLCSTHIKDKNILTVNPTNEELELLGYNVKNKDNDPVYFNEKTNAWMCYTCMMEEFGLLYVDKRYKISM